jgi:hypothetical protein
LPQRFYCSFSSHPTPVTAQKPAPHLPLLLLLLHGKHFALKSMNTAEIPKHKAQGRLRRSWRANDHQTIPYYFILFIGTMRTAIDDVCASAS